MATGIQAGMAWRDTDCSTAEKHEPYLPVLRTCFSDNRKTQARFECVEYGFEEDADVVGTINILRAGHARLACEVSDAVRSPAAGTYRRGLST